MNGASQLNFNEAGNDLLETPCDREEATGCPVFGALVGAIAGALSGLGCAKLWTALPAAPTAIVLAVMGLMIGIPIGIWRGRLGKDIATPILLSYLLLPSVIVLVGMTVDGRFFRSVIFAIGFAFPLGGMLLGGILDRLHEVTCQRNR